VKRFWTIFAGAVLALALAGAGIAIAVTSGEAATVTPAPSPEPSKAPVWLASLAAAESVENGDARPESAEWALMMMKDAAPLLGGIEDIPYEYVDRQMYIVVLKGDFVAKNAFHPAGVDPPSGWGIVLVVDPETHGVKGFSLMGDDVKVDTSKVQCLEPLTLE
jgi:hypothetical protein